ncbi:transposase [Deinococcus sp. VB343]|uniref:Transposase n=1 Tax=Deinococcus sp. VB142 TaxID=3112952 RepID=A0AAU6Q7N5_9DEIO
MLGRQLIRINILFRGRAVPLCQTVIEHGSAQVSFAQLLPLIARAKGILDALGITNVRFLADRGFCDVELMNWLLAWGWHFRIRIKSSLLLADAQGRHLCRLHQIRLAAGESQFHHNVTLTAKHFSPVYLTLGHPTDDSEQ